MLRVEVRDVGEVGLLARGAVHPRGRPEQVVVVAGAVVEHQRRAARKLEGFPNQTIRPVRVKCC